MTCVECGKTILNTGARRCYDCGEKSTPHVTGRKNDTGKLDWTLLPWSGLESVVRVLEFGAKKYERDGWQKVPDGHRRYLAAMVRHVIAHASGHETDPESGESHLAHAMCCALFLLSGEVK